MSEIRADHDRAQAFLEAGQPAQAVELLDRVLDAAPETTTAAA